MLEKTQQKSFRYNKMDAPGLLDVIIGLAPRSQ
jgi:hypothetical protein